METDEIEQWQTVAIDLLAADVVDAAILAVAGLHGSADYYIGNTLIADCRQFVAQHMQALNGGYHSWSSRLQSRRSLCSVMRLEHVRNGKLGLQTCGPALSHRKRKRYRSVCLAVHDALEMRRASGTYFRQQSRQLGGQVCLANKISCQSCRSKRNVI